MAKDVRESVEISYTWNPTSHYIEDDISKNWKESHIKEGLTHHYGISHTLNDSDEPEPQTTSTQRE